MASILVVDDEIELREMLVLRARHEGHIVLSADSAASAIELMNDQKPDGIITDMDMPGGDGLELLEFVRDSYAPEKRPQCYVHSGHAHYKGCDLAREIPERFPFAMFTLKGNKDAVGRIKNFLQSLR